MLKPGGFLAFSTWKQRNRHQVSSLWAATIQKMTPGATPTLTAHDLWDPAPLLAMLQEIGLRNAKHRCGMSITFSKSNDPLQVVFECVSLLLPSSHVHVNMGMSDVHVMSMVP